MIIIMVRKRPIIINKIRNNGKKYQEQQQENKHTKKEQNIRSETNRKENK